MQQRYCCELNCLPVLPQHCCSDLLLMLLNPLDRRHARILAAAELQKQDDGRQQLLAAFFTKASGAVLASRSLQQLMLTKMQNLGKNSSHPPVLYVVHCFMLSQLSAHCLGDLKISFSNVATPTGTCEGESSLGSSLNAGPLTHEILDKLQSCALFQNNFRSLVPQKTD